MHHLRLRYLKLHVPSEIAILLCWLNELISVQHSTLARLGKTTTIRRTAVRETGVSRHHDGSIECSSQTPRASQHYSIEEFKEFLHWDLIIPKDVSLSDSRGNFFRLVPQYKCVYLFGPALHEIFHWKGRFETRHWYPIELEPFQWYSDKDVKISLSNDYKKKSIDEDIDD